MKKIDTVLMKIKMYLDVSIYVNNYYKLKCYKDYIKVFFKNTSVSNSPNPSKIKLTTCIDYAKYEKLYKLLYRL